MNTTSVNVISSTKACVRALVRANWNLIWMATLPIIMVSWYHVSARGGDIALTAALGVVFYLVALLLYFAISIAVTKWFVMHDKESRERFLAASEEERADLVGDVLTGWPRGKKHE